MATSTERAINKALRDSSENSACVFHVLKLFSKYVKGDNYKPAAKLVKEWEKKGLTLEHFTNYHKAVMLDELKRFEGFVRLVMEQSINK